jgi:hypothetical protein
MFKKIIKQLKLEIIEHVLPVWKDVKEAQSKGPLLRKCLGPITEEL